MQTNLKKLIAFFMVIIMLITAAAMSASALTFTVGNSMGIGTITSATNRTVATGVTYSTAVFTDSRSASQQVYALSFNPGTSSFMPYVYSKYSGYGATTINSATNVESKYSVNCVGGVNASFFSFTGTSCNTYGGVNIQDGKVIQGCNSNAANYVLTFNSDGTSSIVSSKVSYQLSVNGTAWTNALEYINNYPETTYTKIYYYDTSCGTSTDTNAAGVEVVFDKTNNTELTVGGTLTGTVSAIRSNVSSGGSIGANQFVLYASDASSYAAQLRALTVGSTASIKVSETVTASKSVMENCNSALVTYGYHIVSNGVNVTASDGLGESFNTARAQRTGVGIKSDGTLIIVVTNGRTTTYDGLTVYELANMLISLGCVTAVDLDGGGSSQMTVQNSSGTLEATFSSTRRVANSLLIVQRPTIATATRTTLSNLITQANNYLNYYVLSTASNTEMQAAYTYGTNVYNLTKSMPGDYTKAIMRLQTAINNISIVSRNTGIYSSSTALTMRATASSSGTVVTTIPANTSLSITSVSGDFGYTKYLSYTGYVDISSSTRLSSLVTSAANITAPDERPADASLSVSWADVSGAAGYTCKILQLAGDPDPGNDDESLNAVVLASFENSRTTSVTIPASSMTNGKYIKIAVCAVFPTTTVWSTKYITGSELPFTDVLTTSWCYDSVKYVYTNGLFSGTSSTTFSPENTMTRGMMMTVLYRLAGSPTVSGTLAFTDVASGSYYYNAILWATQNSIASGYSSTTFGPDDPVLRQQAVVFIYRYASISGDYNMNITSGFSITGYSDYSSIASYALTPMTWAVDKGVISGNNNYLYPSDNATRAQIAAMLKNLNNIII